MYLSTYNCRSHDIYLLLKNVLCVHLCTTYRSKVHFRRNVSKNRHFLWSELIFFSLPFSLSLSLYILYKSVHHKSRCRKNTKEEKWKSSERLCHLKLTAAAANTSKSLKNMHTSTSFPRYKFNYTPKLRNAIIYRFFPFVIPFPYGVRFPHIIQKHGLV